MKIAIVTLTTTARRTGVAEYLINLINELQQLDKVNQYYIFTGRDNRYMFSLTEANFKEINLPLNHDPGFIMRPIFYFWLTFILPFWCRRHDIDLVHLPNTLFASGFYPTVSTIHDVIELKTKKYSRLRTFFRRVMVLSCIKNSRRLITVSGSSARDLVDLGAKQITPIYLGFNNPFVSLEAAPKEYDEVLKKYDLENKPYVIFVGTQLKHKNIPTLVEAFEVARKKIPMLHLVLIGAPDNDSANIKETIERLQLQNSVSVLNFIDHREKLILLKRSSIFCFISSYEGFGIPILEAQAAGIPVIANNISSLPEVAGDGVLLVAPGSLKEETAQGIVQLMTNADQRSKLVELGLKNIKNFSWRKFAFETLNVYTEFKNTR